jgi:phosphopantetheinyl transferase
MPLHSKKVLDPQTSICLWKLEEDEDYFFKHLNLFQEEIEEVNLLSHRKRLEWLASRYLLHILIGSEDRSPCLKDEFGKPYLSNSTHYISLSHSRDYIAVIMSDVPCGVDIQYLVPKIARIARRFMSAQEISQLNRNRVIEQMHVYWGAKESIFKAYGRKSVDFKKHIFVHQFEFFDQFEFFADFKNDNFSSNYSCSASVIDSNFILVHAKSI